MYQQVNHDSFPFSLQWYLPLGRPFPVSVNKRTGIKAWFSNKNLHNGRIIWGSHLPLALSLRVSAKNALYQWNYGRSEQHVWRELYPGPSLHRECDPSGQQGPPTQGLLWGHGGNQQLSEMQATDMCAGSRCSRKYWDDLQVYTQS